MRGGREPHGAEVMMHAQRQGLVVKHAQAPSDASGLAALLRDSKQADVVNLTSFVSDELIPVIYSACDAVLANSGHEPFGLAVLELLAAHPTPVPGSTPTYSTY